MSAYVVAHLHEMRVNRQVITYLQKIDTTLEPYGGRFLVHGKEGEIVEGTFPGHLIIIEFPDMKKAHKWYHSDAYQEIASLRTDNSEGSVIIVDGVADDYQAADLLSK